MNKDSKYLITGGAGYLGKALIARLTSEGYKNLVVISRNEGQLIELQNKFPTVEVITGDIADPFFCDKAMNGVAGVFHLAAFKHVGLAETNTLECVRSNVIGTINLLESSRKFTPEFVVGISTDKAARVNGVYGATKLLQERLFSEYEKVNTATKYRSVRYGNVLYSTGSVLCKWKDRVINNEEVIITDPNSTRFYWTVDQAVDLIFDCLHNAADSTPHITPMKSIRAGDLLNAVIAKYNKDYDQLKIKVIGLQKGENMHEVVADGLPDSSEATKYTDEEIIAVI